VLDECKEVMGLFGAADILKLISVQIDNLRECAAVDL